MNAAGSLYQLGCIHWHLGNVLEAERCSHLSLTFFEAHDLPDVWKVYANLEDLALARNRPEEVAAWRAKKEAKLAELQRLARGNG